LVTCIGSAWAAVAAQCSLVENWIYPTMNPALRDERANRNPVLEEPITLPEITLSADTQSLERRPHKQVVTYLPAIDGLRGIAIALVLWYHAPYIFLGHYPNSWFWVLSIGGWMGVDLFFVVSGFLITTILLRTKESDTQLRIFWARRALRILPLAYLYLSVLLANAALGNPLSVLGDFGQWPLYFFYLGNVHIAFNGFQPLVIMLLWSLAVEEQFYLFWPLAVRYLNAKSLLRLCILILAVVPLLRGLVLKYPAVYVLTYCRMDSLAAGAILAVLYNDEALRSRILLWCRQLFAFGVLAVVLSIMVPFGPSIARPWYFTVFGYSWLAAAFAIILGGALESQGAVRAVLTNRGLRYVGKVSYGLYMWHCLVGGAVKQISLAYFSSNLDFNSNVVLWLACLLAVAKVSWFLFEKPFLDLKKGRLLNRATTSSGARRKIPAESAIKRHSAAQF
jgi:peptidoglycan/LPS O-acetylase OafA/YrhL